MFSVIKNWGSEHFIEVNPDYTVKKLIINRGEQLPRHYHEQKKETFYIMKGTGILNMDDEIRYVAPGDIITIKPGVRHMLTPSESESVEFMELSTTFLTDSTREELK